MNENEAAIRMTALQTVTEMGHAGLLKDMTTEEIMVFVTQVATYIKDSGDADKVVSLRRIQ